MPERYPYHEKSEVDMSVRWHYKCKLVTAKEKALWGRLVAHVCVHYDLHPYFKDGSGAITNLRGWHISYLFWQLSTCWFEFTCNWHFLLPLVHMGIRTDDPSEVPYPLSQVSAFPQFLSLGSPHMPHFGSRDYACFDDLKDICMKVPGLYLVKLWVWWYVGW